MSENYFLRKIKNEDIQDVFQLSNEDFVRKYSINKEKIEWNEHVAWFESMLKSNHNVFYVVTDDTDQFLGQLRYKIDNHSATISISLSKSLTGKGLSIKFLNESLNRISEERIDVENIIAFVSDQNIASKKLFEKANFSLCENNDGMLKYIYSINKGGK
jgi:UDP-2,4-diacetamido-2,4,6-trideoxy-beta-L-altropyranose hydrolase